MFEFCLPTAAAVFAVGILVQSPTPKIFGYTACWVVSFTTFKNPVGYKQLID